MNVHGIHHLTAVSARIQENYDFYTGSLGMRLVKRSVNQDDVSAYHLFYADAVGSPGSDLTFFDWTVPPEQRGTHSIVRTGLRVNGAEAIGFWAKRFREIGLTSGDVTELDGRATLEFEDPEGQRLALIDDSGRGDEAVAWENSPVPADHQIRGLGPITLSVPNIGPTEELLSQLLGFEKVREYSISENSAEFAVSVFGLKGIEGPHAEVHLVEQPGLPIARPGAGGVHHVAFRVRDEAYDEWASYLNEMGVRNSGPVDRYYFRSLYFREPNGILFELATDGPGFAVDEDQHTLGEKVVLPPFLEPRRATILANLKPIS